MTREMETGSRVAYEIVPISEQYFDSLHRCVDSVAREGRYLSMLEAPPKEALKAFLRSSLANRAPHFLATIGTEVVGWCDIVPLKRKGFTHVGRLGMGIHRSHRGKGIGKKLIVRTIEAARARGLERVELEVFASNGPAAALYDKVGFVVEGVKKRARKLGGVYDDIIEMALFL